MYELSSCLSSNHELKFFGITDLNFMGNAVGVNHVQEVISIKKKNKRKFLTKPSVNDDLKFTVNPCLCQRSFNIKHQYLNGAISLFKSN